MPLKLFIVEDSAEAAEALSALLAADGACVTVGHATSEAGALAWSFHNEAGFDVAIVDLLLQQGSGFAVLAHLSKYQPGKLVVLSDFATPGIADKCRALGAAATFAKSQTSECVEFVRRLAAARP